MIYNIKLPVYLTEKRLIDRKFLFKKCSRVLDNTF